MARTLVVIESDNEDRRLSYAAVHPDGHTFGAAETFPKFGIVDYPEHSDEKLQALLETDPGLPAGQAPKDSIYEWKLDLTSLPADQQEAFQRTGHLVVLTDPTAPTIRRRGKAYELEWGGGATRITNPLPDREERESRVFIARPKTRQALQVVIENRKTKNSDLPAVVSEAQHNQICWNVWRGQTLDEIRRKEAPADPLDEPIDRT